MTTEEARILIADLNKHIDEEVVIKGWIDVRRDQGKLIFFDFRDFSGMVQGVVLPNSEAKETASMLRPEWVIEVKGKVNKRPDKNIQAEKQNGDIELEILGLKVLNEAKTPPFPIDSDGQEIDEELRLKHRYVDLRRPRLQKNLKLRSKFVDAVRQFLFSHTFTEIETPYFTSTTPEGSRDFVVPSRMYPGQFFALPQSPQQYKQLLMVAGFERYFQIARCFRDEDLRSDRGFEHTQIDLEMSFAGKEDIMRLDELMITTVCEILGYQIKEKPFPRISYKDALEKYGADKFDMRTEEDKEKGILAFAWVTDFPFFEKDKNNKWTFTHNPFSMPSQEHLEQLLRGENIGDITTQQYDLVCNGFEVGGGSVRAHKPEILRATFKIMGYSEEEITANFGHMIEAFEFGAPPHAGIAHGIERMIMILANEKYLREVQAFPQTAKGHTSVMDAPGDITTEQLLELGISVKKKEEKK